MTVAVVEQNSFDHGAETWPWNSFARCRVGLGNEVIRRVEREKRAEKTNNAVFPLAHHVIRTVVRCTARVQAVDDLAEGEGGGFVRDGSCTAR